MVVGGVGGGDQGHMIGYDGMIGHDAERIASQSEVIRAIVSGYSPGCGGSAPGSRTNSRSGVFEPARPETQTWDTSQRVATAAASSQCPELQSTASHRGEEKGEERGERRQEPVSRIGVPDHAQPKRWRVGGLNRVDHLFGAAGVPICTPRAPHRASCAGTRRASRAAARRTPPPGACAPAPQPGTQTQLAAPSCFVRAGVTWL